MQQLQAFNQQLGDSEALRYKADRVQELEIENARLIEQLQASPVASPILDREHLNQKRDRVLKNWRIAKAPEKKERIQEALDRFIEAIHNQ